MEKLERRRDEQLGRQQEGFGAGALWLVVMVVVAATAGRARRYDGDGDFGGSASAVAIQVDQRTGVHEMAARGRETTHGRRRRRRDGRRHAAARIEAGQPQNGRVQAKRAPVGALDGAVGEQIVAGVEGVEQRERAVVRTGGALVGRTGGGDAGALQGVPAVAVQREQRLRAQGVHLWGGEWNVIKHSICGGCL